jgi:hypothetical protein
MGALSRRLYQLEKAAGVGAGFTTINVLGGLPGDMQNEIASADQGRLKWTRRDGESATEFRNRANAEARAAGKNWITFGGFTNG